jgi:hypothetical protein
MLPAELTADDFDGYPPEARKLAVGSLAVFRRLPLTFLPNLLREVIEYDFKFPSERRTIEKELANLNSLSPPISYASLDASRAALSTRIRNEIEKHGMGPEKLRSVLARMRPEDPAFSKEGDPASMPRGTASTESATLASLLSWMA